MTQLTQLNGTQPNGTQPNETLATQSRPAYDDGSWLRQELYCAGCGRWLAEGEEESAGHRPIKLAPRLWVYTNYDCNLQCSYCLVSSSPFAERRAMPLPRFRALLDEAALLGVRELFLTGGEPFLLPEIFEMLQLALPRFKTTVLTNAMVVRGKRLEALSALGRDNLLLQVSLDDVSPGLHDAFRGAGSWDRTVEGIRLLQERGFTVRVATTVTPELEPRIAEVRRFVEDELRIPPQHHIVRPLLRRGFSEEGLLVGKETLMPELTVDNAGVYWHPAGTDDDLRVARDQGTLRVALEEVARLLATRSGSKTLQPFR